MAYSHGKGSKGENRGPKGQGTGPSYSSGKNSSIARGISTGRGPNSKIEVGYGAGQKDANLLRQPDKGNRSKPFKPGGRA